MGYPEMVPKGNLSEMVSNWKISIGYEDNQIMTVLLNWEAIHKCQYARDAECIKKVDKLLTKSPEMTHKLAASSNEIEVDIHHSITKFHKKDMQMNMY